MRIDFDLMDRNTGALARNPLSNLLQGSLNPFEHISTSMGHIVDSLIYSSKLHTTASVSFSENAVFWLGQHHDKRYQFLPGNSKWRAWSAAPHGILA